MNAIPAPDRSTRMRASAALALAVALTLLLGIALPGLGLLVAAAFAFTAYRGRRRTQVALFAIGVVATMISLSLIAGVRGTGGTESNKSKPVLVRQP